MSGIIGNIVKIENKELLSVFYPNFEKSDRVFYDEEASVIYNGPCITGVKDRLKQSVKEFIIIWDSRGPYDIDLDLRDVLIEFVSENGKSKISDNNKGILMSIREDHFYKTIKKLWVAGYVEQFNSSAKIYNLCKEIGGARYDLLQEYMRLRETWTDSQLMSFVLNHLEIILDDRKMPANRNGKFIIMCENQRKSVKDLRSLLYEVYTMGAPDIYRALWMLFNLGKGEII